MMSLTTPSAAEATCKRLTEQLYLKATRRNRTGDLLITNQLLYHLS